VLRPVYASHLVVHLLITLYPAVLFVLRQETGESYAVLGGTYGAAMLVYGLGALPVGALANRVRPLTFLRVSTVGAALASGAIAIAPSPLLFAAALIALGAACSIHHTAALTLITRVGNSDPRLFGHYGMLGNLGLAIAPAFGGVLAAVAGWRLPFAAGCALACGVAAWLVVGGRRIDDGAPVAVLAAREPQRTDPVCLALVYVISASLGFVYTGFAAFLPAITGLRVDFLPAQPVVRGGIVASCVFAIGFFGQWWGGYAGRRGRLETRYALVIGLNAACLLAAFALGDWGLIAVLAVFSFAHFSTQPLENTLIAKFTSHQARAMSFAVSCVLAFGVGSLGAWAAGSVADLAGERLQYVFLLLAAVAAVATLCAAALRVAARRAHAQVPSGGPAAAAAPAPPPADARAPS